MHNSKASNEEDNLWDDEVTNTTGVDSIRKLSDRLFPCQSGNSSSDEVLCSVPTNRRENDTLIKARFLNRCAVWCAFLLKQIIHNKLVKMQVRIHWRITLIFFY